MLVVVLLVLLEGGVSLMTRSIGCELMGCELFWWSTINIRGGQNGRRQNRVHTPLEGS